MDEAGDKIRKLREDKSRLISKNYELAQELEVYRKLFRDLVDSSQGHLAALLDIINIVNSGLVDDDAASKIRDICNGRLFASFNEEESNDDPHTMISDEFKKLEALVEKKEESNESV